MEDRTDLLQLYGSVGTDNFLGSGLPTELQIGKFTQAFGKSRLIARSNYSNVPYSFVGAHWTLGTRKDWEVRAFVMSPVQNHQTSPDTVSSDTLFSGLSYLDQRMPWFHTELYALLHIAERAGTGHHRHQSGPKYPRPSGRSLHPRLPALRRRPKQPSTTKSNPPISSADRHSSLEALY